VANIPQNSFSLNQILKDFPPAPLSNGLLLLLVQIYITVRGSARSSDLLHQRGETVCTDDEHYILKGFPNQNEEKHIYLSLHPTFRLMITLAKTFLKKERKDFTVFLCWSKTRK